jgi:hypothetical protein
MQTAHAIDDNLATKLQYVAGVSNNYHPTINTGKYWYDYYNR